MIFFKSSGFQAIEFHLGLPLNSILPVGQLDVRTAEKQLGVFHAAIQRVTEIRNTGIGGLWD